MTVLKGYQELVDELLVEKRRGLGLFVRPDAHDRLMNAERRKFLTEQWPEVAATIRRLGLTPEELERSARSGASADEDGER